MAPGLTGSVKRRFQFGQVPGLSFSASAKLLAFAIQGKKGVPIIAAAFPSVYRELQSESVPDVGAAGLAHNAHATQSGFHKFAGD
jgi:hypothetical protein